MTEEQADSILRELLIIIDALPSNKNHITVNRLYWFILHWPTLECRDTFYYCMHHSDIYYKEEQLID